MNTIKTITLSASEVKNGKQSFISCVSRIGDKWYKIKFTKDVTDSPKEKGLYELTFDIDNASIEKGKPYTNKNGKKGIENDTIWVRKIDSIKAYTEEDYREKNRVDMAEIFGE